MHVFFFSHLFHPFLNPLILIHLPLQTPNKNLDNSEENRRIRREQQQRFAFRRARSRWRQWENPIRKAANIHSTIDKAVQQRTDQRSSDPWSSGFGYVWWTRYVFVHCFIGHSIIGDASKGWATCYGWIEYRIWWFAIGCGHHNGSSQSVDLFGASDERNAQGVSSWTDFTASLHRRHPTEELCHSKRHWCGTFRVYRSSA